MHGSQILEISARRRPKHHAGPVRAQIQPFVRAEHARHASIAHNCAEQSAEHGELDEKPLRQEFDRAKRVHEQLFDAQLRSAEIAAKIGSR